MVITPDGAAAAVIRARRSVVVVRGGARGGGCGLLSSHGSNRSSGGHKSHFDAAPPPPLDPPHTTTPLRLRPRGTSSSSSASCRVVVHSPLLFSSPVAARPWRRVPRAALLADAALGPRRHRRPGEHADEATRTRAARVAMSRWSRAAGVRAAATLGGRTTAPARRGLRPLPSPLNRPWRGGTTTRRWARTVMRARVAVRISRVGDRTNAELTGQCRRSSPRPSFSRRRARSSLLTPSLSRALRRPRRPLEHGWSPLPLRRARARRRDGCATTAAAATPRRSSR